MSRRYLVYCALELAVMAVSIFITRSNLNKVTIPRSLMETLFSLSNNFKLTDKSIIWAWNVLDERYYKYKIINGTAEKIIDNDLPPNGLDPETYWNVEKQMWSKRPKIDPYVNNERGIILNRDSDINFGGSFVSLGGHLLFNNDTKTLELRTDSSFPKNAAENDTISFTFQRYLEFLNMSPLTIADDDTKEHPFLFFQYDGTMWQLKTHKIPIQQLPEPPLLLPPVNIEEEEPQQITIHIDDIHAIILWINETLRTHHLEQFNMLGYPNVEKSMSVYLNRRNYTCALFQNINYFNTNEKYLLDMKDPLKVYEQEGTWINSLEYYQPVLIINNSIYGMNKAITNLMLNSMMATDTPFLYHGKQANEKSKQDFILVQNKCLPHVEKRIYKQNEFYVGRLGNIIMDICVPFPIAGVPPTNNLIDHNITFPATRNLLQQHGVNMKMYSFGDIYTVSHPLIKIETKKVMTN